MRVLWHTNFPLQGIKWGEKDNQNEGWNKALADIVIGSKEIELILCFPQNKDKRTVYGMYGDIMYIAYYNEDPALFDKKLEERLAVIIRDARPDIIHIMGTEYPHSLSVLNAARKLDMDRHVVVSIQGPVAEYAEVVDKELPESVVNKLTLYDKLKGNMSVREIKEDFQYRGIYERELLKKARHIIGRTDWDRSITRSINKRADYYVLNEVLRPEFYRDRWTYSNIGKHNIFISQATYSLKGFHVFIKALILIKKKYPDVRVLVAGHNPLLDHDNRIKMGMYERYCYDILKKYDCLENMIFLSKLNAEEMKDCYLSAGVFVSPSFMENSCNSVGEAMILGVPTVSSAVGGIDSLIEDGVDGLLYEAEDYRELAKCIHKIFVSRKLAASLSDKAVEKARELHDREEILTDLISIYHTILL